MRVCQFRHFGTDCQRLDDVAVRKNCIAILQSASVAGQTFAVANNKARLAPRPVEHQTSSLHFDSHTRFVDLT
jgi:hypothetical protein